MSKRKKMKDEEVMDNSSNEMQENLSEDSPEDVEHIEEIEEEIPHTDNEKEELQNRVNGLLGIISRKGHIVKKLTDGISKLVEEGLIDQEDASSIMQSAESDDGYNELMELTSTPYDKMYRALSSEIPAYAKYNDDPELPDNLSSFEHMLEIMSPDERDEFLQKSLKSDPIELLKIVIQKGKENRPYYNEYKKHGSHMGMINEYKKKIENLEKIIASSKNRKSNAEYDTPTRNIENSHASNTHQNDIESFLKELARKGK